MSCSICQHPQAAEMVVNYAYTSSLRVTAGLYGVGYKSLERHFQTCIYIIMRDAEEHDYKIEFAEVAKELRDYFTLKRRRRRFKSIVKKQVDYTWSRRGWKSAGGTS